LQHVLIEIFNGCCVIDVISCNSFKQIYLEIPLASEKKLEIKPIKL